MCFHFSGEYPQRGATWFIFCPGAYSEGTVTQASYGFRATIPDKVEFICVKIEPVL